MALLKFVYFGVRIALEWDNPELDECLWSLLLPIWSHQPELIPTAVFRISSCPDGAVLIHGPDDEPPRPHRADIFEALERRIHFYLANHCQGVVFVHAGAVAWQGRVILIPGSSFSGKSTLTHQLVQEGAEYLSDEYAVIDQTGAVHPFPRPIALRVDGGQRLSPEHLCAIPSPVVAVIATRYQAGRSWKPTELSPGRAAMELMAHTVTARKAPGLALSCLSTCVQNAIFWAGPRGDARQTARLILRRLTSKGMHPSSTSA